MKQKNNISQHNGIVKSNLTIKTVIKNPCKQKIHNDIMNLDQCLSFEKILLNSTCKTLHSDQNQACNTLPKSNDEGGEGLTSNSVNTCTDTQILLDNYDLEVHPIPKDKSIETCIEIPFTTCKALPPQDHQSTGCKSSTSESIEH